MRRFLGGLTRLTGVVVALACVVAVVIGHLAPEPARFRVAIDPAYDVINGFVIDPSPSDPRLLDLQTGGLGLFRTPEGDLLDYASLSPWEDEEGESQVVGRWVRQSRDRRGGDGFEFGVARYSVPSGRVLDQVPLPVVPASDPCWFPGMTARVLYAASDGLLYNMAFERDGRSGTPRPEPIAWRGPALRFLVVRDPTWPSDPRLGGRLIVSLAFQTRDTDLRLAPARLWWVRLNADASAVVDGAPLTDPEQPSGFDRGEERFANAAVGPDGRLRLAYLRQVPVSSLWELRVGVVDIDAAGRPSVRTSDDRLLAQDHLGAHPSFSSDGRYLFGLHQGAPARRGARAEPRVVRYPAVAPSPAGTGTAVTQRPVGSHHG